MQKLSAAKTRTQHVMLYICAGTERCWNIKSTAYSSIHDLRTHLHTHTIHRHTLVYLSRSTAFGGAGIQITYYFAHCVLRKTPAPINKKTMKMKSGPGWNFSLAKSHGVNVFFDTMRKHSVSPACGWCRGRARETSVSLSLSREGGGKMTRVKARETSVLRTNNKWTSRGFNDFW